MRRDLPRLLADAARRHGDRRAGSRRAATGIRAQSVRRRVCVAFLDHDGLRIEAELFGHDLRPGGFVALALGFGPGPHDACAGRMDADFGAVEHLDAENVEMLRWSGAYDLGERREPDAHQLAARALLSLLLEQLRVADLLEREIERLLIVAAVVGEAERRRIRKLLLLHEVLATQLRGVHAERSEERRVG